MVCRHAQEERDSRRIDIVLSAMKKSSWVKIHNVAGTVLGFFLLMLCLSGIVLNHRDVFGGIDVSRKCLPPWYRYGKWNGGLLRGTLPLPEGVDGICREPRVLLYGAGGIMLADPAGKVFKDFNRGLPDCADGRQIRAAARDGSGQLYALSPTALYRFVASEGWRDTGLMAEGDDRFSDLVCRGDTIVVAGRSYLYVAARRDGDFRIIMLKEPDGYRPEISLFRIVWMLHSGEMFGLAGRLFVDAVGLAIILLCVTGWCLWFGPARVRGFRFKLLNLRWHNRVGVFTMLFTGMVILTGWCLRPPLMIPLVMTKVSAAQSGAGLNPWHDRLRMIRYDDLHGDWLVSASDGFYSLKSLDDKPVKLTGAPPVSVMGLNVWEPGGGGKWICGSFSGLYVWDRSVGSSKDFYTGEIAADKAGPPFGKHAVSGYSADFGCAPVVALYHEGTDALVQPARYEYLPLSLWNVALEVHSGRIYFGASATYFFIFIIGAASLLLLWSGWKIRLRSR